MLSVGGLTLWGVICLLVVAVSSVSIADPE